MRHAIRFVLIALLFSVAACADQGAERDVLNTEPIEALNALMQEHVEQGHIAGGQFLLASGDEVLVRENYGMRDLESGAPMTDDTIYRIYSMSKTVTSAAVMMLVEDGQIELDDLVAAYLPAFGDLCVYETAGCAPLERPVTVRHLLTHTAGLTYGEVLGGGSPVDSMYQEKEILWGKPDLEGFVGDLTTIPLLFQPGERWHYSVSIDVLGRLVEVVSGESFDVFLETRLFEPLGMVDTGFTLPAVDTTRLAGLYDSNEAGMLAPGGWDTTDQLLNRTFWSGGGGLLSTADDYLKFSRMLMAGGELGDVRILDPATVDTMMANHLDRAMRRGYGFGLGGQVVIDAAASPEMDADGAFSWSGAANTFYFIDRENDLIAFLWVQLMPYGKYELGTELLEAAYGAIGA